MYKNKISLFPPNTCSFMWVFTVSHITLALVSLSHECHCGGGGGGVCGGCGGGGGGGEWW